MQTFLPYDVFSQCARVLDRQRLGKQRVEAWQIMRALRGETAGWTNHPATRMWRGYEAALCEYGAAMCMSWKLRGYKDTMLPRFTAMRSDYDGIAARPLWLGDEALHESHRAHLIRKDPDHYGPIFGDTPDVELVWPA